MGGKSATTTQQVQIPPEVMARYRAVNLRAEQAAQQPFQAYSQDPNAFVAPFTGAQQAAMQNFGMAQNIAQPYYQTGAGLTMAGARGVGPLTQEQIGYYQNPFTQSVVGSTLAGLQQQQGQQLAQQQANAIRAGAFGGDRAGIERAQLMGQQNLATAQAIAPLYQQAYQQAVQTAAGQQGVLAQDLQRQLAAGQQLGGLGSGATQTALQAAQGLMGAGTAEQQTQQAGLSALYNQFLQERGYPFQVAQFLANIAMGTGALSGSTTTTQQPVPFFSDLRNKRNVQVLGRDPDTGNLIIAYDDKDDLEKSEMHGTPMPPKRVGPIAQELEAQNPGLVGEVGGHKVVKGLAPEWMGGPVVDLPPGEYREHKADGGGLAALYAQFGSPYGAQQGMQEGPYGGRAGYLKSGLNPPGRIAFQADTRQVKPITTGAQELMGGVGQANAVAGMFDPEKSMTGKLFNKGYETVKAGLAGANNPSTPIDQTSITQGTPDLPPPIQLPSGMAYGGLVGYAEGGEVDEEIGAYKTPGPGLGIPTEMEKPKTLQTPGAPSSSGASGLGAGSQILGAANAANSLYTLGSTAMEALPALLAFIPSDERIKEDMHEVGRLHNGLPVYGYKIDGVPQIGVSAQEATGLRPEAVMEGRDGLLRVDYDRVTRADGGLVPRMGYQEGGRPSFDEALERTLRYEGGYDPNDVGSPTMMGIRQASNPDVDLQRVKEDPAYRASIYRERYWNPIGADRMDPKLATIAFDTSVNLGPARTKQLLEEAGNDPVRLLQLRQRHYNNLIAQDPETYGQYERGWSNRVRDLMSYAGESPRSPGSEAIDRQAGAPRGLAGAAPQEEASSWLPTKFGTKTLAAPKGEQFKSFGDFLTSRQFVQPALEGLAAMASSPSLFAGSAALQGLGAASRAYTGLEKEMAGLERQQEETRQVMAGTISQMQENAKKAYYTQDGKTYVLLANGRRVLASMYDQNPAAYGEPASAAELRAYMERNPQAKPLAPEQLRPPYEAPPSAGTREGDLSKREPTQPAQTLLTEAPKFETGKPTPYALVGSTGISEIERDANNAKLRSGEMNKQEAAKTQAQLSKIRQEADGFRDVAAQFDKLASLALSMPETGWGAPGPLNQLQIQWANYVNAIMDTAGLPKEYRIKLDAVGLREGLDKIRSALELSMGQQSRDALAVASSAVPNANMSRQGFVEAYAPERIRLQRFLDENRYIQDYQRMYERKYQSAFPDNWSFESAKNAFEKDTSPDLYRQDTERMKWLMTNVDPKTGKTYWSLYSQNRVPTYFVDRQTGAIGYRRYFEGFR